MSQYTLYNYWRSSCSYRVRIALELKRLAYRKVDINLVADEQYTEAHRARSPLGQVPVLEFEHEGKLVQLSQSLAILGYLDDCHPDSPILPADGVSRAKAWAAAELVNAGIQPLQNLSVLRHLKQSMNADADAFAVHFMLRGLTALEAMLKPIAGRYSIGDQVSIADICLVPQMYNARRFKLPLDLFPTLVAVDDRCCATDAFLAAAPKASDA